MSTAGARCINCTWLLVGYGIAIAFVAIGVWTQRRRLLKSEANAAPPDGLAFARGLPAADCDARAPAADGTRGDLLLRMTVTAALILGLAAAADRVGPHLGGILAALPVLACVLAVFAHRWHGGAAAVQLLRGMLVGMTGFVVFCALVAALATTAGVAATFALATVATVAAQSLIVGAT